ncbi:hypothetical protein JOC77_004298 [Peribacillus deserti]|uniref:Uncharacterized protein n=1 Tax=Peribacillus deserti TaxID=673318 RepID=A0ABS2QQ51_9BACI|nr:hypothetical protein [Peribacillus deserti]MBM7694819.1 hypothetical protein [Peribacillus deserti]
MRVKKISKKDGKSKYLSFEMAVRELYNTGTWEGDLEKIAELLNEQGRLLTPFATFEIEGR